MTGTIRYGLILLLLSGCTLFIPKETRYLRWTQGATIEDVRQPLGQPTLTTSTAAGGPVWVYHVYQQETGSQQSWGGLRVLV